MTSTGIDDLFDVVSELQPVRARWKHIGLALRLSPHQLKMIEFENRGGIEDGLTEVLTRWLVQDYDTMRFGEPSWELLAQAVGHPAGGNNAALSDSIRQRHEGVCLYGAKFTVPNLLSVYYCVRACTCEGAANSNLGNFRPGVNP